MKTGKVEASASLRVIDYVHRMQEKEKSIAASESAETVACPSDELQEKAINAVQLNSENVSELVAVLQVYWYIIRRLILVVVLAFCGHEATCG